MKGLSLEMVGIFAGAVDFIAQKGMPKAGHMYTDLVGCGLSQDGTLYRWRSRNVPEPYNG